MRLPPSLHNLLTLLFLSLLWSSSLPAIKIAVAETGPVTLAASRAVIGFLTIACLLPFLGRFVWRKHLRHLPYIFVMSLVGMCLPFYLISRAELVLEASMTGLLLSVGPLFTVLLAHFLLRRESLSWGRFGGVFVGFMGIVVLLGPGASSMPHAACGDCGTGNGNSCDHGICVVQSHGTAPAGGASAVLCCNDAVLCCAGDGAGGAGF